MQEPNNPSLLHQPQSNVASIVEPEEVKNQSELTPP